MWSNAEVRALVVDDEEVLRKVASRALGELGLEVVTACDGLEAWELLQRDPRIRLVVTDVRMPRMDGLQLAALMRGLPNPPALLFMSGYGRPEDSAHAFTPKPFRPTDLADLVAGLLQLHAQERVQSAG
jgi:two-component system cell cycle sensor histidine kinase/response regulator CckA